MNDPADQLRSHFTGLRLREEHPQGQVYVGADATGAEVTVAVLAAPLAGDPGARNAFADVVWRHSIGSRPDQATVYAADLHAPRPWAAVRGGPGGPGAEQLLVAMGQPPPPPTSTAVPPPPVPPDPVARQPPGYTPVPSTPATQPAGAGWPPGQPVSQPPGLSPGQPANVPPPYPPPAGGYGSEPGRGPGPWLVGGAVAAVIVLAAAVVGVGVWLLPGDAPTDDRRGATTGPRAGATTGPPPSPDPSGPTGGPDDDGERPQLREVEQVSVVGPTFDSDDDTYTMAFPGWPVAFRVPGSWGCLRGEIDFIPDAAVWRCVDEGAPQNGQYANVLLWECPTDCTDSEQQEMIDTWLDEPDQAVQWESSPTYYVETEENFRGNYSVDLGHFFGPPDGELRWLVGVYIESPPDTRAAVQKLLNDVISQAG